MVNNNMCLEDTWLKILCLASKHFRDTLKIFLEQNRYHMLLPGTI